MLPSSKRSSISRCKALRILCALAPALGACISTELDGVDDAAPFCTESSRSDSYPLLDVTSDLGPSGIIRCSGVAIAPRLALTNSQCLTLPNELGGRIPELSTPASSNPRSVFPNEPDGESACDESWSPTEDGTFAGRLEDPVAVSTLSVALRGVASTRSPVGVRQVVFSGAQSRCADDLALLLLSDGVVGLRTPIRLEREDVLGEAVKLIGGSSALDSQIEQVTFELGSEVSPPRSLVLLRQACARDLGGGVFSADTGSLIGVISATRGSGCQDAEAGQTIATRLAPFQRLIVRAAGIAGESIAIEPRDEAESYAWPACAASAPL